MLNKAIFEEDIYLEREEKDGNSFFHTPIKIGFPSGGLKVDHIELTPFEELVDDNKKAFDPIPDKKTFTVKNLNSNKKSNHSKLEIKTSKKSPINTFNTNESAYVNLSGLIHDETGQPMPSATISVVNKSSNGTQTDFDGNYNLSVKKGDKVEVRFIGYKTLFFDWNKIPKVIKMQVDANVLEEVKLKDVKKKSKKWLYAAGIGLGVLGLAIAMKGGSKSNQGLNGAEGLKANGRLKKGFRYGKGGKIIKVKKGKTATVTM